MKIARMLVIAALEFGLCATAFALGPQAPAAHTHHHHHAGMQMDRDGMVMNSNTERLPEDCDQISQDFEIVVRAGCEFARPGLTYGFDTHRWSVRPCARVAVTLHNDDEVRHQWMVHGLPRYLYPQGMFHLEANGGKRVSGTFIVPSDDATYLVHCDVSHHMEQGLKAQLVVGAGSGDLPSIPGLTGARFPDRYR